MLEAIAKVQTCPLVAAGGGQGVGSGVAWSAPWAIFSFDGHVVDVGGRKLEKSTWIRDVGVSIEYFVQSR